MDKIEKEVKKIIEEVKIKGDKAICFYTQKFDKVKLRPERLLVKKKEIKDAYKQVDEGFITALKKAKLNIESFHKRQRIKSWYNDEKGILLGDIWQPLEKVGVYIPGGKYAYPSCVLMNVLPAKVAGVSQVIMVSPPGNLTPAVLVAADICGVDRIYRVGGVPAIAALAYGTDTLPRVDKIVGPGNIYVTCAKKMLFGEVGIDMLAGPSEIMILADQSSNCDYIISDFLAQLEHDRNAKAGLVTTSAYLIKKVQTQLRKIKNGFNLKQINFFKVKDLNEAIKVINQEAPEHLEILTKNPEKMLLKIKNAGAIFLGEYSPVVLGDYFAGPSHTLPTGKTARFSSGLSVYDFMKRTSLIFYSKEALKKCSRDILKLAEMEGLKEHMNSVKERLIGSGEEISLKTKQEKGGNGGQNKNKKSSKNKKSN
ncbi:histidinol dehydrogenase [bacterium]|nr:histidinol dehydrogenase [bacterium]